MEITGSKTNMLNATVKPQPLTQIGGLIKLIRPRQWIKNGFVLAPLIFAGELYRAEQVTRAVVAALLFCLASSATYIVNDVKDVERDKLHPVKSKTRPLAAGIVTKRAAFVLLATIYATLILACFFVPSVLVVIWTYVALNLAYSSVLKHQPVVDIFTIALGFVLRVYAGAVAVQVPLSAWMFVTTLCLALYLAAVKRRQELLRNGVEGRAVLGKYSIVLIDRYAQMSATAALLFYSMFVMESKPQLVITVPLVLFGLFRYWYLVEEQASGESPTDVLLADWQLILTIISWAVACIYSLWPA